MTHFKFFTIAAIAIILAVSFEYASALRCWMCNSKDDPGCGDPFNSHIISSSLFVECPYVALGKSLCIKAKSTTTGMVHRYCSNGTFSEGAHIQSFKCSISTYYSSGNSQRMKYDTAEICEPCNNADGCNGAAQYGPIAVLIAISMAIMKMLTF